MDNFEYGDIALVVGPKRKDSVHWSPSYDKYVDKRAKVVAKDEINYYNLIFEDGKTYWFHASTLSLEDEYGE